MNENTEDTESPRDTQVKWDCFSCGKHIEEQGAGGSFTLDFGYGSRLDRTQGINGWVCDECVAQKHGRLRVALGATGREYWLEANMVPLSEHTLTRDAIADLDFYGRRKIPWALDNDLRPRALQGWRLYHSITSEERSRIEASLFTEEPIERDIVVKLLQAVMESEAERAKAEAQRWQADQNAFDRARNQAERLSPDELAQLRVREAADKLTREETQRVWEHAEWNERHFREQEEQIKASLERIAELEGENAALKDRLTR